MSNEIKVGDKVRSYDFPGRSEDHYYEGEVVGIGEFPEAGLSGRYKIKVAVRIWQGIPDAAGEVPEFIYPPVNGQRIWGDPNNLTNGVKKVEA